MKRIAALAALVITMIAVPAAAAMASTGGSGPGHGSPGPVQVRCHPVFVKQLKLPVRTRAYLKQFKLPVRARAYLNRHPCTPVTVRIACPYIPAKPQSVGSEPRQLVFNMAAGSSTLTEVSGPTLSPAQEFSYDGNAYTIASVDPGAHSFTVFKDGWLFVNRGTAITGGLASMCCPA